MRANLQVRRPPHACATASFEKKNLETAAVKCHYKLEIPLKVGRLRGFMGKRGPIPKPEWLKVIQGNPGKRTLPSDAAAAAGLPQVQPVETLDPPPHFNEELRLIWNRVCEVLAKVKALTVADQFPLVRYVELTYQYQKASEWMVQKGEGMVAYAIKGEDGKARSMRSMPQLDAMLKISNHLLRIEQHFGLTPSARANWLRPAGGSDGDYGPDPFA